MAEDLLKIFEQAELKLYFRYRVDGTYYLHVEKNTIIALYILKMEI